MSGRERERLREKERDRDRDRDRDGERRREKDDRDRKDRDRSRRSRTPDRTLSRHTRSWTRSPDRRRRSSRSLTPSRSRSRSPERSRRRHHRRTPSPDAHRSSKRRRDEHGYDRDDEKDRKKAVSDFVDGIAREHQLKQQKKGSTENGGGGGEGEGDADEIEMMKQLGIPTGFDSTKGKPVPGADVSGVRAVTKRQPRQYMNRRGGFNRPLPAERNRS